MAIPSNRVLKGDAARRVASSENANQIIFVYIGILTLTSVLVAGINYCLGLQIAKTGGLSNMGLRSMLSTIQSVLPMLQGVLSMCLQMGYTAAMMRISRQQYTSVHTLKLGFDRFWLLLRTAILQSCLYMLACIAAFWISAQVFLFTPMADTAADIMAPAIADGMLAMDILLEEPLYSQLLQAMIPLFVIFGVLYLALLLPIAYGLRMVNYIIVDKPGLSAAAVLRESRKMMKGNRIRLVKLDLSLWLWYLLTVLTAVVGYGDSLLPMVGIALPISGEAAYFLFYGISLAVQFALFVWLRNKVEVTYVQFYDHIRPKEQQAGVVLGNIFQLQEDNE